MQSFIKRHPLLRRALTGPRAIRRAWMGWREQPSEMILERISDMVKGNVIFEAKEFLGTFSIDPRSHLLHRFLRQGYYEPAVSKVFLDHVEPEGDVIDVGANIGFFTIAGAKNLTTGRLLAAEPTAEAFGRLRENVFRNGVAEKVILFNGMIGAAKGDAEIHIIPGLEEYSSLSGPEHFAIKGKPAQVETVSVERIDDITNLHDLRPALMKVDVEGAEFSVFSGAQYTISTYRPVVISELWRTPRNADGHTGAEIVEMFRKHNYIVRDLEDPKRAPGLEEVSEIICIPKEKT